VTGSTIDDEARHRLVLCAWGPVISRYGSAKDAAVVVGLVVAAALFWRFRIIAPATVSGAVLGSGDFFTQIYPMWYRASRWMLAGTIPLWNPFQFCGYPFLATVQYGVLYPLNLPFLLLRTEVAIEVAIVLHLFAAGLFMYLYGRGIRLSRLGAAAAAITFMWSGFMVSQAVWFTSALAAAAWLPLAFLAVEKICERQRWRWAVLLATAVAMPIFAGYLQTWVYSVYAVAAYASARVLVIVLQRRRRAPVGRISGLVVGGVVLGLCLAAIQILPSFELQALTPRHPGGLPLGQLLPFGPTVPQRLLSEALSAVPGPPRSTYLGVLALLLIPLSGCASVGRWRTACLGVLALLSIGIAISVRTPLFQLYRVLPVVGWFRFPERILVVYAFAGAALCGIGFNVATRAADATVTMRRMLPAVLATVLGLGWLQAAAMPALSRVYLCLGVILFWAAGLLKRRLARRVVLFALVSIIGCDLFNATQNLHRHPYHGLAVLDAEGELFDFIRRNQGLDRTYIHDVELDWAVMAKQGTLREIYSITDYEPLSLSRYEKFFHLLERPALSPVARPLFSGMLDVDPRGPQFRLFDLMSVRYIVTPTRETRFHQALEAAHWQAVWRSQTGRYLIYENSSVLPRAYVAYDVIRVRDEEAALPAISQASFDPTTTAVVEADTPDLSTDRSDRSITAARIVSDQPTRIVIESDAPAAGYLVLTDTSYPGWKVAVDGEPRAIYPANYLFRAVPVPAGHHVVTYVYDPLSFKVGAGITLAALGGIALGTALRFAGRRRTQPTPPSA